MCSTDEELTAKMLKLEKTLQTFRAEVNMKMSIVEQVLNNRNEQFQIQKDLLEREHSLYQTVLVHWKNIEDMAANGISLHFAQTGSEDLKVNPLVGVGVSKKRPSSSKARRERSKRLQSKRQRNEQDPDDGDPLNEEQEDLDTSENEDQEDISCSDYDSRGLEKKVYVNFYTTGSVKKGEKSNNPIWKYYLREENGMSAMCKLCEDEGTQHILKTRRGGTWNLYRHLKKHIPDISFPQQDDSPDDHEPGDEPGGVDQTNKESRETDDDQHDVKDRLVSELDVNTTDTVELPRSIINAKRKTKRRDAEEKLPGWMQFLEPFFDFVDFTGKKTCGTPDVVMRCKECSSKKPNNKGIRGRGSHNFARHLKIHPQSNAKYISSLFEHKRNMHINQQQHPEPDQILPYPI